MSRSEPPIVNRLSELCAQVEQQFHEKFLSAPTIIAAAPGRVNLIGEHVDYNDGFVLPMAIDRYLVIAAAPAAETQPKDSADVYSLDLQEHQKIPLGLSTQPTLKGWGRYLEGVASGFAERGTEVAPFCAVIGSDIPSGSGLSSSAALEVATATMLEAFTGVALNPTDKALLCQRAEHLFAGVPCGIMDQFSSVFGRPRELMLLDCRSQQVEPISLDDNEISVLIVNSRVRHELAAGEYAKRRSQCNSALAKLKTNSWRDVSMELLTSSAVALSKADGTLSEAEIKRSRHVVSEIERTQKVAALIKSGDWHRAGELMYESHQSLRDDYEVSCRELDILVELASGIGVPGGVFGSRMTGGGFGGCTVSLVKTKDVQSVEQEICQHYKDATGIDAHSFATRPARGAQVIRR